MIINVGLCVSVFDLLETGDPYVHSGEASAFVKVTFRCIIFRPIIGEVIKGRIRSSSEEGIHVSIGFFDDILIPATCMREEMYFEPSEQVWLWKYDEETKMYLDNGEQISLRILNEQFTESAPLQKDALMAARAASLNPMSRNNEESVEELSLKPSSTPYKIIASIAEDGLGPLKWWQNEEEPCTTIETDLLDQ